MSKKEFHYRWEWHLAASPEALWPLVSDTNRFNRDTAVPHIHRRPTGGAPLPNRRQRLRLYRLGVPVEWVEEPFEWVRPQRFGVIRRYCTGPVAEMRVLATLTPDSGGGTHLVYEVWARPSSVLGLAAIPGQIGLLSAHSFSAAFKLYGKTVAGGGKSALDLPQEGHVSPYARRRLETIRTRLHTEGAAPGLVDRLLETVTRADDLTLMRLRPYALADHWGAPRREALELCLAATRAGLLDLQWDIVCPICRGAKETSPTLTGLRTGVHCDSCRLDFVADFERLVELTFRPNPAMRKIERREWCIGGPQITPHIVAQQLVQPGAALTITLPLEAGRYRLRAAEAPGVRMLLVGDGGLADTTLSLDSRGWPKEELNLDRSPTLRLENRTESEQLFILERMAWNDQAATAAEVTALQRFRDLFANEALRPGEQVSVGTLTVLFTDLRGSTFLYREIGDAPAFGRVMSHFDVLREAITEENGALVKTIGDAVMAVFRHPACAVRAVLRAQSRLASEESSQPLQLKAGIHSGPCIAVTLNDRLDYFGTTVNIASRLESLSSGADVVISDAVRADPEVATYLAQETTLSAQPFESTLKGYDGEQFDLWRISQPGERSCVRAPALLAS